MANKSFTSLIQAIHCEDFSSYLTPEVLQQLVLNFDPKETDRGGWDTLSLLFIGYLDGEIVLNHQQWEHLLQKSDLKHTSLHGHNALMLYINFYHKASINLSEEQKNYLFEHSNVFQTAQDNQNILNFLFKEEKNLTILNQKQIDYLVDNLTLDLSSQLLLSEDADNISRNYNSYKIEKEKRFLGQTINTGIVSHTVQKI